MSISWRLVNSQGSSDMVRGDMDIIFQNGVVIATMDPLEVLDQRVRKCVSESQGDNSFDPQWGSTFRKNLGHKNLGGVTQTFISSSVIQMMNSLISSQKVAQRRITLAPSEIISSIASVQLVSRTSTMDVVVQIVTNANNAQTLVLPSVVNLV